MRTKEIVAAEFMADLKALLAKHKAELTVEECGIGFYESYRLVATISAEFDSETCETKSEWTEIEIGWADATCCEAKRIRGL